MNSELVSGSQNLRGMSGKGMKKIPNASTVSKGRGIGPDGSTIKNIPSGMPKIGSIGQSKRSR